jgi:glycolate oxidase iron-sulfur subunit
MATSDKVAANSTGGSTGTDFIEQKMKSLNLLKNKSGEEKLVADLGKCLNCGICLTACPVLEATSYETFAGPKSIATTLSRVNPDFWNIKDVIYTCAECGSCQEICPEKVPIPRIVDSLRAKIYELRPDLIPEAHKTMLRYLSENGTSIPPEDQDLRADLAESAMKDLGLPHRKDAFKDSAEVAYFAGCLSTHRALEIRESGKLLLDKLGSNYTLLKDEKCCGLPASLIGDDEMAYELARSAFDKAKQIGAKTMVATCAGCANTLQSSLARIMPDSGIQVKHLVEYLVEDIGLDRISKIAKSKDSKKKPAVEHLAIHPACHLSRHLSRRIQDYIVELAEVIPGVELTTLNTRNKCCGAGGLLSSFKPDIANKITKARLQEILEQGKNTSKIVAPCPTCTIQLGQSVANSPYNMKVEDLTVFLARRLI